MKFKKYQWIALSVVFCMSIFAGSVVASESEEGFKSIFNGKDLTGWIIQGMEKAGPKVKDGVLEVGGWDYWAVITKKEYKDFILRFDAQVVKKGNGGILFHTAAKEIYKSAIEIQITDDGVKDISKKTTGAIYGQVAPSKQAMKALGEWNTFEIKVQNNKVSVTINGELVQDGVDVSGIEKHKNTKGRIAIQRNDYKKAINFKNIRVKEL